eukprot:2794728-Rhodomonas_salina.5
MQSEQLIPADFKYSGHVRQSWPWPKNSLFGSFGWYPSWSRGVPCQYRTWTHSQRDTPAPHTAQICQYRASQAMSVPDMPTWDAPPNQLQTADSRYSLCRSMRSK